MIKVNVLCVGKIKEDFFRAAIAEYSKITPATAESMLGIASSYQAMNDYPNAISYYQKAMGIKPQDSDIPYYIAVLYAENEDWANAKTYLEKSLALNKNNEKSIEFLQSVNEQLSLKSLNQAISLYENEKYDESLQLLDKILSRITLLGALCLGVIALIPSGASYITNITTLQGIGATSLIIMVGVALDFINQIKTQLLARNYESFLKE